MRRMLQAYLGDLPFDDRYPDGTCEICDMGLQWLREAGGRVWSWIGRLAAGNDGGK